MSESDPLETSRPIRTLRRGGPSTDRWDCVLSYRLSILAWLFRCRASPRSRRRTAWSASRGGDTRGVSPLSMIADLSDLSFASTSVSRIPKPRMSLQCWDSGADFASVKIMIGNWGRSSNLFEAPQNLSDIGAYLRAAGQSLGIVIDTPRLDTQAPFSSQIGEITEGLEAALRLQDWWGANHGTLKSWARQAVESST